MIVIAIIALLAAIAAPSWLRSRKRSQAARVLNDLRMLDNAVDQYAVENSKSAGAVPVFNDLRTYVKTGTVLYLTGDDLFGDTYGPFTVDSIPKVPQPAFQTLSDVAPASFWSPYY